MDDKRKTAATPIITAILAFVSVTLLLAIYVRGYIADGKRIVYEVPPDLLGETDGHRIVATRFYGTERKATFYRPAAVVESWLTGTPVTAEAVTY